MKILLYSPVSLSYGGGTELYLEHLALSLKKQFNDEVRIVCGDVDHKYDRYEEIHYYQLGPIPIPSFRAVSVLSAHMRWAEVVYFSFGYFGQDILMLVLKWIAKRPVIAAVHAPLFHSDPWHNRGIWLVSRFLLPHFDGAHLLSKRYRKLFKRWGVRKITVVPCGVNLKTFHPRSGQSRIQGEFRVLFVGRMTLQKGYDVVASLLASKVSVRIRVVTDVPHAMLPPMYRRADLLLFPSREETSPAVLFEAMACGIPVLARHTPENREILGADGWYVKGDSNAWIEALQTLKKLKTMTPLFWEQRRKALRMRATRFDFDSLVKKLRHQLLRGPLWYT